MKNDTKDKKNRIKKKSHTVQNKKRRNNKVIKAKDILAQNKAAIEALHAKEKAEPASSPKSVFRIVKNVIFITMFVVLAVAMITFLVVRMNGGTPSIFGYSIQRITSGSMEPELSVGDIILSKEVKDPEDIDIDDIITFKGGSYFDYNSVTHRVVIPPMQNTDGEYVLTTQGDANVDLDPEIRFSTVMSKYIKTIDFLRGFYDFFLSPWGLIVFIAALLAIFFDELLTVAKVITGNYNEEDEDEDLKETMERLRREEEEERILLEQERERKRRISERYGSTSKKKQKALKNRKAQEKKKNRPQDPHRQKNSGTKNRRKNPGTKSKKKR